jgi:hypothetical protein
LSSSFLAVSSLRHEFPSRHPHLRGSDPAETRPAVAAITRPKSGP